jgi:hypothetical protein
MPRMIARSQRITQVGLGADEADEAEQVDAWWNPPPAPPVSCPSIVPPAAVATATTAAPASSLRKRRETLSLESLDDAQ